MKARGFAAAYEISWLDLGTNLVYNLALRTTSSNLLNRPGLQLPGDDVEVGTSWKRITFPVAVSSTGLIYNLVYKLRLRTFSAAQGSYHRETM